METDADPRIGRSRGRRPDLDLDRLRALPGRRRPSGGTDRADLRSRRRARRGDLRARLHGKLLAVRAAQHQRLRLAWGDSTTPFDCWRRCWTRAGRADWRLWAEVVWGDTRAPDYIGDMPHTWIAAEFATAIRRMLLRENGRTLELFRGAPDAWWENGGVTLSDLPTAFGVVNLRARRDRSQATVDLALSGPRARTDHVPLSRRQAGSRRRQPVRNPRRRDPGAEPEPPCHRLLTLARIRRLRRQPNERKL